MLKCCEVGRSPFLLLEKTLSRGHGTTEQTSIATGFYIWWNGIVEWTTGKAEGWIGNK